ncbi:MAG: dicarboxylate/amino acid:cation symporter [Planctomycetes bacterium]|nr:dicarboxylate/amino acid:cation symporter [Planctomycetota bacterium]
MIESRKPWYRSSTCYIFAGLALGIAAGGFFPFHESTGENRQIYNCFNFLSGSFIALIKSIVIPLIVATVIVGVGQAGDMKTVGRMGGKALLYFEIVTTIALFIGLFIVNWLRPGDGLVLKGDAHLGLAKPGTAWDVALHTFPSNFFKHAAEGDILPVVVFATLIGIAAMKTGERGKPVLQFFDSLAQVMFRYTNIVMLLTPLGVFGAMAANVSKMAGGVEVGGSTIDGWPAVGYLLKQYSVLVGSLYLALALLFLFVFIPVMLICGIRVWRFLRAVRDPALTAFSTASSEAALPTLLEEMIRFGVPKRVASFVIPTGYSFNLDGSTLYLVMASIAIAQAAKIEMSISQQLAMMLTLMLTSKGVAGVPRATLVIIMGTCASFNLPGEAGVAMLLAVDSVMDMGRTCVNVVGNGLASVVVSKWEGNFGTGDGET